MTLKRIRFQRPGNSFTQLVIIKMKETFTDFFIKKNLNRYFYFIFIFGIIINIIHNA